jgi:MFS transporter, SHS family, lactate transporter
VWFAWRRELNRDQWNAFIASFLGWALDGYDAMILTFLLVDIQRSFTVNKTLAGAVLAVTLLSRLVGGVLAGIAADRWGRKGPLMFSILWYSLFAFVSGFSTSYGMLFACRALFGIGMGGVWAAGMPLTIEHWPVHLRGHASGLLQGGFSWGYILAAIVFQFVYPLVSDRPDFGWRVMLWTGILPAFIVLWIMRSVKESPVWLARKASGEVARDRGVSLPRIFASDLIGVTLQTSLVMGAFMFSYQSMTTWYATFLQQERLPPLGYLIALNVGGIAGSALWGRVSETRAGRRGAVTLGAVLGMAAIPLYVNATYPTLMLVGALAIGLGLAGAWGILPGYLSERFPTEARSVGAGFAYHAGAALGAFTPWILGLLQDRGLTLASAMTLCLTISGVVIVTIIWAGPETRGRRIDLAA